MDKRKYTPSLGNVRESRGLITVLLLTVTVLVPQYHVVDSASGRDPPAIDSGHRRSEPETAPCQPTADVRDGTPRRESSPRSSELLEEDPNAARRKRLKTSPEPTPVAEQARDDEPKSTLHAPEARDSSAQQAESVHNTPPENAAAQPGSRPQTPTKETHPPKKVIKLNANGKLLSSPPAPRTENKPQRKGREKRKSSPEKTPKSKLVIFRYGEDRVSKEAVKMLNEILAGRQRYSPIWRRHFAPKPAGDSKPKPTHPFFLKKVPRQPAEQSPITENADEKKMSQKSSSAKSGAERVWQSSRPEGEFTKSLFPKQPDLVDPLWPPKGMVHIRDGVETPRAGDIPTSATDNQRKDKVTAVDVLDTENLLLTEYSPCRDSEPSILRPPGRNVMLCEELQKEVGNRLSHTPAEADDDTPSLGSHPSLRRLYHSVKTHLSAFDIGESETRQWVNKYAPTCANDVLQAGPEVRMLRDWLKQLMVSSVDTGRASSKDRQTKRRKKKRRKAADKLDGFIVSSDEEASEMGELSDSDADELAGDVTVPAKRTVIRVGDSIGRFKNGEKGHVTNAVLISGPSGCGKTASVYAVAKELDFKVFEINSATRRSARDILERVGDMTQNHLVQRVDDKEGTSDSGSLEPVDDKQRSMTAFFKAQPSSSPNKQNGKTKPTKGQEIATTTTRTQKQSLILLEEADILFEEDKQFWAGVTALIEQSKRPVIITCNDESLIPLQDLSLHAIFRYRSPPVDLAVDYLLLIAANEGHLLRREAVKDLYLACGHDLRKSLMELNFWCQMAVGSTKSGIDWILDRWTKNEDCRRQRVVSADTYRQYMGWLGRDMLVDSSPLDKETELILEKLNWWNLDMADSRAGGWDSSSLSVHSEKYKDENRVHRLQDVAALTDSWSVFDLLSRSWSLNPEEVSGAKASMIPN